MSRLTKTTAILIETQVDEDVFTQRGQIVRYAVPSHYRTLPNGYARLHNDLREKLAYPYYFYTHDRPEPAVYVLQPSKTPVLPLTLDFMNGIELKSMAVPVGSINEFHILVKLLQAAYFQSRRKEVATQGRYYIVAQRGRDERFLTCLRIEIRAAPGTQEGTAVQEFKVIDSATRFRRWDRELDTFPKNVAFFGSPSPKGGQTFLRPLKVSELPHWEGTIYVHSPKKQGRTTLPFHSTHRVHESRGYLLYTFIHKFLDHLQGYGVRARAKQRQFTEFHPLPAERELPLAELGTVWLLDNRLNQADIPLETYEAALKETLGNELGLQVQTISQEQISPDKPLLVL